ncbi:His/Gly/Thr/Pro-type tRNA ligase C-terminal domain-containing protein, partial [Mitsuokella multacida]|uniref:His/Gly/Thr/Pro-type tRNA ligase C-terminal domain-containing protein n=1 Tax=Mitsuokella multacida TaxID=52226 RepID=UPI003FA31BF1
RKKMFDLGLRIEVDDRSEKIGKKIRESQMPKTPYSLVVGDQEMADGTVAVRKYGEQQSETMKVEDFIAYLQDQIATKAKKF